MTDEEQKDIETQDEDSQSAGPVAEEDSSSSQAAGEDSPSTPPAEEESASDDAQDDAPAEEEASEPEAAEAEPAADSSSEEDELPWKEKRRLQKSRRPHEARPQQSPEEREAARGEARKAKSNLRRTQRAAAKAGKGAARTGTPAAERTPNAAKVRQGIVVSDKADKSITVRIDIARRHPTYEKVVRRSRTLHAHDEQNQAGEGDVVRVVETRPLSKTKRWRLVEIVEKAR